MLLDGRLCRRQFAKAACHPYEVTPSVADGVHITTEPCGPEQPHSIWLQGIYSIWTDRQDNLFSDPSLATEKSVEFH